MNLRIGDHDRPEARVKIASVRPGAAAGRTRTALSDIRPASPASPSDQGVVVRLSPDAQKLLARSDRGDDAPVAGTPPKASAGDAGDGTAAAAGTTAPVDDAGGPDQAHDESTGQTAGPAPAGERPLSSEQKDLVTKLAARDTAVRAHEAAHQAAAAGLGGGASFTYETGPDGKRYAVGGEVPVSLRSGRTPQETLSNAQTVRSAALAPADPSSQDLAVAAQATQMEAAARQQMAQVQSHGGSGSGDGGGGGSGRPVAGAQGHRGATGAVGATTGGQATAAAPGPASDQVRPLATPQAAPGQAQPDPPAREAVREQDQLAVFSTLKAERSGTTVNGHLHSSGGACFFCARAAARYA